MTRCQPVEHLERFLREELPDAERLAVEAHVESCSHCQVVLARLTEGGETLRRADALACPEDPPLTEQDEALLAWMKQAPSNGRARPPAAPSPRDLPQVPGYTVLEVLGEGGMGVVYKARQTGLDRLVALKTLRNNGPLRPEEEMRFRVEGELVARLHHPNIVQIYEVGTYAGGPFFAFEYVDGGTLQARSDGTPLPANQAAELVEIVARAVHYAHLHGIIHRDLKPSNVLLAQPPAPVDGKAAGSDPGLRVTPFGIPKVADFGLAKRLDAAASAAGLTSLGLLLGTPRYMAPEQFQGDPHKVGPATDVHALGLILYELLTGRVPFDSANLMELGGEVLTREPTPPRRLRPGVPRDLESICLRCLEKQPRRRYATAEALADDLRRFLAGEPIRARPVGVFGRAWRLGRRNPLAAALAAAACLSLLIGTALSVSFGVKARGRAADADLSAGQARAEKRTADRLLYAAHMTLAQRAWADGWLTRVQELLDGQHPDRTGDDLRGFEWYYWQRMLHSELRNLAAGAGTRDVAFSPDGTWLAATVLSDQPTDKVRGGIKAWETATGQERWFVPANPSGANALAFRPDGRHVASTGADGILHVVDADGHSVRSWQAHLGPAWSLAYSPDNRLLVSGADDGTIAVWDAETGAAIRSFRGHGARVARLTFPTSGNRLASAGWDKVVKVWEIETGKEQLVLEGHTWFVHQVTWSPDGRLLASGGEDRTIYVWDAATGRQVLALKKQPAPVWGLAFSLDGRHLVSSMSGGGLIRFWSLTDGEEVRTIRGHTRTINGLAFSPDGRLLMSASADGTVKLWDPDGQGPRTLRGHSRVVTGAVFSPDGERVASAGWDGTVRLWDADTGRETACLRGHRGRVQGVAFRPDGGLLASASEDGDVRLWDGPSGAEAGRLTGDAGKVLCVAWAPDGGRLVEAGEGGHVTVWQADTGRPILSLRGHTADVLGVAWSPDGRRVASSSKDRTIRLWDAQTGELLQSIPEEQVELYGVAFDPDGGRLAIAAVGQVVIWDVAANRPIHSLRHSSYVTGVAWSPDGKRLAAAGWDRTVTLWDPGTGQETCSLLAHDLYLTSVAFSRDGGHLVTASQDSTVKVWDARP